jgi:predicted dehydrogenase
MNFPLNGVIRTAPVARSREAIGENRVTKKVGIIGCGHIARFHARNIKDAVNRHGLDVEYHATCDVELSRARTFAEIAGCTLVTADARELVEACDAVYICTETVAHPELVTLAADARRHIFCEKPLAKNAADARAMAAAVASAGVINQVGLILNYSPVFCVMAQLIKEQDPGVLLSAHLRDDQCFPVGGHYGSTWRGDVTKAGGGTLLEHSIHDVDLLRRLFGEIEAVQCRTRELSGHAGIEDVAQVSFHHAGGHTSTLASLWHSIPGRQSSRSLEVFFDRARYTTSSDYFGTITYQIGNEEPVTLSNDEVLARFMALQNLKPVEEDLRSLGALCDRRFLQAVAVGATAEPDFEQAVISHDIVEACYASARDGGRMLALG